MTHRSDWLTPPLSLVYAAAGGYFVSFIVQMKFFDYHALPVSMFLLLALSMSVLQSRPQAGAGSGTFMSKGTRVFTIAVVLGLGAFNTWDFYSPQYNGNLSRLIRTLKPAATVTGFGMVPGSQIRAVRDAGGSWVGSFGYTYVPGYAQWYRKNARVGPHWAGRLAHWERWTAEVSTRDIVQKKPDVIVLRDEELVRWPDWIKKYPKLNAAMSAYRFHSRVDVGKGIYPVLVCVRN